MPKMTVVTFALGRVYDWKPILGSWLGTIGCEADLLFIDNAPNDGGNQKEFLERFIQPFWNGNFTYLPQADNLGVIESMQLAYERLFDSDIIAYLHNDLFVYDYGWGRRVLNWFEKYPETGLLGFFGAEGVHPSSGRFNVWNNMMEAEIHGWRFRYGFKEVAVLDGLCMIASRKMLAERNGLDRTFRVHHFYDLDLSLESIDRGYKNYVLPVYCHHQSGVTACGPLFQEWANRYVGVERDGERQLYDENLQRFKEKWAHRLPYHITSGWKK